MEYMDSVREKLWAMLGSQRLVMQKLLSLSTADLEVGEDLIVLEEFEGAEATLEAAVAARRPCLIRGGAFAINSNLKNWTISVRFGF